VSGVKHSATNNKFLTKGYTDIMAVNNKKTSHTNNNTNTIKSDYKINTSHIDVLDGIRAMAILIVVWFHIWQQCWLIPNIPTPFLERFGINLIDLDWLPRTGYMMVTMMIFLSGFCLYLPYARNQTEGTTIPSIGTFYKKRVARIVPSYLFAVCVVLIYNIFTCAYTAPGFFLKDDSSFMLKDILSHLTFTYNLIPDVASHTLLNGVLWTVALEVQFYIIFPFIAYCFKKQPIPTYVTMNAISYIYISFAVKQPNVPFLLHQLPSYMGVYANGFLGVILYMQIAKNYHKLAHKNIFAGISTVVSLGCIYVYSYLMKQLRGAENLNIWQLENRFYVSILFLVFILATAYSVNWYKFIFSNKLAKFISLISFNLYIWHQFLCTAFKNNRIPYYEGDTFPNELGDKPWMWKLLILSFAASFAMAIATTFLLEKPASRLITKIGARTKDSASSDSAKKQIKNSVQKR